MEKEHIPTFDTNPNQIGKAFVGKRPDFWEIWPKCELIFIKSFPVHIILALTIIMFGVGLIKICSSTWRLHVGTDILYLLQKPFVRNFSIEFYTISLFYVRLW